VRLNVRVLGPVADPKRQLPEAGSENTVHRVAAPADVAKIQEAAARAGYLVAATATLEYHGAER
jgi:hypothetical protein